MSRVRKDQSPPNIRKRAHDKINSQTRVIHDLKREVQALRDELDREQSDLANYRKLAAHQLAAKIRGSRVCCDGSVRTRILCNDALSIAIWPDLRGWRDDVAVVTYAIRPLVYGRPIEGFDAMRVMSLDPAIDDICERLVRCGVDTIIRHGERMDLA